MNKTVAWLLGTLAIASVAVWGIVGMAVYLNSTNKEISDILPTHFVKEATASLFTGPADFIGTWENLNGKGETIDLYESGAVVRKTDPKDKNGWVTGVYKIDGNRITFQFADGTTYSTELSIEDGTMTWDGDVEDGALINWSKTNDVPDDHFIVKATKDGMLVQNVEQIALAETEKDKTVPDDENPYGEPEEYETTEIISYDDSTPPTNANEHDGYIWNSKGERVRVINGPPVNAVQSDYPETVNNQPEPLSQDEIDEAEENGMMNIHEIGLQEDTPIVPPSETYTPAPYYTGYATDSFNTPLYQDALDGTFNNSPTDEELYPERYYDTDTYTSEEATPISMKDVTNANYVWGILNEDNDAVQEAIYDGADVEQPVSKGWIGLDFAVQRNDMQLARILFRAGANPLSASCGGKYTTVLQYCSAKEPGFYNEFVAAYYDE